MRRRDILGRSLAAGVLATAFASQAAQAALPTGGMMLPRPKGPARADLPCSTAISATRIPSAAAYGLAGEPTSSDDADPFSNEEFAAAERPNKPVILPRKASASTPNPFSTPGPGDANPFAEPSIAEDDTPPNDSLDGKTPFDELPTEHVSAESSDADFAGLKGICPVTLREERKSVAPRPGLFSEHAGRRYEFATPEAKAAFDANPERYAPVLGGRDVVLTAGGVEDAVGSLQHAGFYRERLYLFQTAESCKEFYENPQRFLVGE